MSVTLNPRGAAKLQIYILYVCIWSCVLSRIYSVFNPLRRIALEYEPITLALSSYIL